ncbi:MAG: class I SAM-dependent methyltransferase, partial [Candidatus Dormibacteria bacterium]
MTSEGVATLRSRSQCRGCHSDQLELFVDLGPIPLAGGFATADQLAGVEKFLLRVHRCAECNLVQILDIVPPDVLFRHYLYESSTTQTLRQHFAETAHLIASRLDHQAGDLVVEIGCNDGVLLEPLAREGFSVLGVDPARNVTDKARARGLEVMDEYFTHDSAARIRGQRGPAKAIIGNNVLAHIDDMDDVLDGVRTLLADGGWLIFEVHYVGDLIELNQFDTIYHEHLCYYSVGSLRVMLGRFGLHIVRVEHIPIHSGSIRVWARVSADPADIDESVERYVARESELRYSGFGDTAERCRDDLLSILTAERAAGKEIVGYGAPGRGTTLLNYCGIDRSVLTYVTDESSLRQGRFVPGVDIPIVSPDRLRQEQPDFALLLAWNYEGEVLRKES